MEKLTRRNFLSGTFAVGLGFLGLDALAQTSVSYIEAVRDPTKRQAYIDQIVSSVGKPPYVLSVEYAEPRILEELKGEGYIPPQVGSAATRHEPVSLDCIARIGNGLKSKIYVFEEAFADFYKRNPDLHNNFPSPQVYDSWDIIIKNIIINNEFIDAFHFHNGINGYPITDFKDRMGEINLSVYLVCLDLLSLVTEYEGLRRLDSKNKLPAYVQAYGGAALNGMKDLYGLLNDPKMTSHMDENFLNKLKRDFQPGRLLNSARNSNLVK